MIWIKLQIGAIACWTEIDVQTEHSQQFIRGLKKGAELFSPLTINVIDQRFSKHQTEQTFTTEAIQQIIKEQSQHDNQNH